MQYNAIMLIRILSDNPGETFTRNMDAKFVHTVKDLLKHGRDPSVQQILRETLAALETKTNDYNLEPMIIMWRAEKERQQKIPVNNSRYPNNFHVPAFNASAPPIAPSQQPTNQRIFGSNRLPSMPELASRMEEARNTAKLLLQLLQSTPTDQVLGNDLMKEFADRCQAAQRSVQEYINCDDPPPDDDTLQTLIEVNEQLSLALSRHQRAVLSARRAVNSTNASPNPSLQNSAYPPPSLPRDKNSYKPLSLAPPVPQRNDGTNPSEHGISPVSSFEQEPYPSSLAVGSSKPVDNPFAAQENGDAGTALVTDRLANASLQPSATSAPMNQRPGAPSAYYPGATPSFLGRQASAADGLTMHGGVVKEEEQEPEPTHNPWAGQASYGPESGEISPVSTQSPVTYRF